MDWSNGKDFEEEECRGLWGITGKDYWLEHCNGLWIGVMQRIMGGGGVLQRILGGGL